MKILLAGTLILTSVLSTQVKAQALSATAAGIGAGAVMFGGGLSSIGQNGGDFCEAGCQIGSTMTFMAPISALIVTILGAGGDKQELALIKDDAVMFVAGFEKTLALEDFIAELKSQSDELAAYSDEEIALALAVEFN